MKPTPEISDALEELEKNYYGKSICARIASVICLADARYCELEVTNMTLEPEVFQRIFFDYSVITPVENCKCKRGRKKTVVTYTEKITKIVFYNNNK